MATQTKMPTKAEAKNRIVEVTEKGHNGPTSRFKDAVTGQYAANPKKEEIVEKKVAKETEDTEETEAPYLSHFAEINNFGVALPTPIRENKGNSFNDIVGNFPSVLSSRQLEVFSSDEKQAIAERKEIALRVGIAALGKDIANKRIHLSRNEERKIFKPELKLLDKLLTNITEFSNGKTYGYVLRKDLFKEFNNALCRRREEAKEDLIMEGDGIPGLPIWGTDGNINKLWEAVDFEILGAVYRTEAEIFLTQLSAVHEFTPIPTETELRTEHRPDKRNPISNEEIETLSTAPQSASYSGGGRGTYASSPKSTTRAALSGIQHRGRIFGVGTQGTSSGRRFSELFTPTNREFERDPPPHQRKRETLAATRKGKDGPPDDSDSSDSDSPNPGRGRGHSGRQEEPVAGLQGTTSSKIAEFDNRLKIDIIPTWDGNIDELSRWILKINRIAERSQAVREQLGVLVPTRLSGIADTWYYSLPLTTRHRIEENWDTLRKAIGDYFMNRAYLNKQKIRANKATYRDSSHPRETPSEYYIRKYELLEFAYEYNDEEIINEIMSGAPTYWTGILTPHLYTTLEEFQNAIKFHEDHLLRGGNSTYGSNNPFRYNSNSNRESSRNPFNTSKDARVNLVGWSASTSKPPFPKDDSNISPKGTPVSKGGRPCRHCGSDNHWDPECKYARKGEKRARVHQIQTEPDEERAQEEYDELYYNQISDDELESADF